MDSDWLCCILKNERSFLEQCRRFDTLPGLVVSPDASWNKTLRFSVSARRGVEQRKKSNRHSTRTVVVELTTVQGSLVFTVFTVQLLPSIPSRSPHPSILLVLAILILSSPNRPPLQARSKETNNDMATVLDFRPPHAGEENVISVVAGETQYRWAIHEKKSNYFPVVCWRTSNILRSEVDSTDPCVLLSRYLPDEALGLVFGVGNNVRTKERAAAHRATLRMPAISVYVLVSNVNENEDESVAIEFLSYIFRDVPCNFFQMQRSDFLGEEYKDCSSLPYTNLEQVAVLKAADELMSERRVLLIDSGTTLKITSIVPKEIESSEKKKAADKKTGEATSEKKENETKAGEPTSEKKKATEEKVIEETKTNEQPNSESFCLDAIRVTTECQSLSITSKLRALHENTGALPSIDTKTILKYLQPDQQDAKLQLFATNTVDAMVGSVVQETMLFLRNMVKSWVLSNADHVDNDDKALLLVCFTGQEGEILKKLLNPSDSESSELLDWNVNDEDVVMKGYPEMTVGPLKGYDLLGIRRKNDSDTNTIAVEVKAERYLVHYGIQRVLAEESQAMLESLDELGKLRKELVGCRIAKTFDSEVFRGQVMMVESPDSEDGKSVDLDIYFVRYDDGDDEGFSASELYGE